jgi:hypothetical protein
MHYRIHSISKVCALVAATLIIPALAYAKHDNGKDNDGKADNDRGNDRGEKQVPVVLKQTQRGRWFLSSVPSWLFQRDGFTALRHKHLVLNPTLPHTMADPDVAIIIASDSRGSGDA